jgi:hypothetical protein
VIFIVDFTMILKPGYFIEGKLAILFGNGEVPKMRKPTIIETVSRYMKTDEEFRLRWLAEKEKDDKLHNKAGGMNAQRRIAKKLYEEMNEAEKKNVHELHASECKRKEDLKKEVAENMETDIKEKGKELARFCVSLFIIYLRTANGHPERKQLCTIYCKQHCSDFTHLRVGSSQSWELFQILIHRSLSHSRKPPIRTLNVYSPSSDATVA